MEKVTEPEYEPYETVFREYFASNRGPGFDFAVVDVLPDQRTIGLRVTFRAGATYCCGEPGCHFGPDWQRLRELAERCGVNFPCPLRIEFHGVVEPGVRFELLPNPSEGYEYHEVFDEET